MPSNENANQQNEVKQNRESSFRKPTRKAPGTRMGTLQDWRGANNNSGKPRAATVNRSEMAVKAILALREGGSRGLPSFESVLFSNPLNLNNIRGNRMMFV